MSGHKLQEIQSKLYKLETWLSPQIETKSFHQKAEQENKERFEKYIQEFQRQVDNQEIFDYTNDLITKLKSHKKHFADQLTLGKKLDLREIFQGQRLRDPDLNYRLQKKIEFIASKLEKIITKGDINTVEDPFYKSRFAKSGKNTQYKSAPTSPSSKAAKLKNQMVKKVEKVLRKFEEKDVTFDAVSRSKLQKLESKLKYSPPLGKYHPKYEAIDRSAKTSPKFNLSFKGKFFLDPISSRDNNYDNFTGREELARLGNLSFSPKGGQGYQSIKQSGRRTGLSYNKKGYKDFDEANQQSISASQRCQRSIFVSNEGQTQKGSTPRRSQNNSQNQITPQSKLILDFGKIKGRDETIGAKDVNEKRFENIPLIEFNSKYRRLGCNISFKKQVYRGESQQNQSAGGSISRVKKSDNNASLAPGYYNPNYNVVSRREDKFIQVWNKKEEKKAKFDITREIKQKENKMSVQAIIKEDEEMLTSLIEKIKHLRRSTEIL